MDQQTPWRTPIIGMPNPIDAIDTAVSSNVADVARRRRHDRRERHAAREQRRLGIVSSIPTA